MPLRHCQGRNEGCHSFSGRGAGPGARSQPQKASVSMAADALIGAGVAVGGLYLPIKINGSSGTDVQQNTTVSAPINHAGAAHGRVGICLPLSYRLTRGGKRGLRWLLADEKGKVRRERVSLPLD